MEGYSDPDSLFYALSRISEAADRLCIDVWEYAWLFAREPTVHCWGGELHYEYGTKYNSFNVYGTSTFGTTCPDGMLGALRVLDAAVALLRCIDSFPSDSIQRNWTVKTLAKNAKTVEVVCNDYLSLDTSRAPYLEVNWDWVPSVRVTPLPFMNTCVHLYCAVWSRIDGAAECLRDILIASKRDHVNIADPCAVSWREHDRAPIPTSSSDAATKDSMSAEIALGPKKLKLLGYLLENDGKRVPFTKFFPNGSRDVGYLPKPIRDGIRLESVPSKGTLILFTPEAKAEANRLLDRAMTLSEGLSGNVKEAVIP